MKIQHAETTMHYVLEGVTSYVIAFFLMFVSHVDSIVSWGGLILLFVRLIADGPRAYEVMKDKLDEWRER
jgi:hypothetical protein